jgi:hypothetical protein
MTNKTIYCPEKHLLDKFSLSNQEIIIGGLRSQIYLCWACRKPYFDYKCIEGKTIADLVEEDILQAFPEIRKIQENESE